MLSKYKRVLLCLLTVLAAGALTAPAFAAPPPRWIVGGTELKAGEKVSLEKIDGGPVLPKTSSMPTQECEQMELNSEHTSFIENYTITSGLLKGIVAGTSKVYLEFSKCKIQSAGCVIPNIKTVPLYMEVVENLTSHKLEFIFWPQGATGGGKFTGEELFGWKIEGTGCVLKGFDYQFFGSIIAETTLSPGTEAVEPTFTITKTTKSYINYITDKVETPEFSFGASKAEASLSAGVSKVTVQGKKAFGAN